MTRKKTCKQKAFVLCNYVMSTTKSDYYRKLMSSFLLLPGTMEAKFILIAVILPVIASQGINKGKNWMLKSINFFTRSFSWPPTPPGKVFEHHHHPPTSTPQTYPLEKMQCTVPPTPNNHPGIFKESASYLKYLNMASYIFFYFIEQCLWTTQQPMNVENPPSSPVDLRSS